MADRNTTTPLENTLLFPVFAASNLLEKKYKALLRQLDLTYTQYLVMTALWSKSPVNEKYLCETLSLKYNTLSPILNTLCAKGYISKTKDPADERNLVITLTEDGEALKEKAASVHESVSGDIHLTAEEILTLNTLLNKVTGQLR